MADFEWDERKNAENQAKHGISFATAQQAFADSKRVIAEDLEHSRTERRFFCFGRAGGEILTVRFTHRAGKVRIIGAGYWRKGKAIYEKENKVHRRAHRKSPNS